jgi:hypothetical protein
MSVEPGGRERNESSGRGSPTLWIGIAVVCALAAVGLGIWAFTTKSDLDDAEAKIDAQQKALAAQRQVAGAQEQRLRAFGDRERVDYRRVRRRLIAEDTTAADLKKRIENEAAQLDRANQDVRNAQGATETADAQLKQARARSRLAVACSASAVDALSRFNEASNPQAGAKAAVKQLSDTADECAHASEQATK